MGISLHTTAYGPAAEDRLRELVRAAKADDPLAPVTVVVPTNSVGVAIRRRLATGGLGAVSDRGVGVAGLTLLTVYRLAELLGAPSLALAGRRPVSTPIVAAAVRGVLSKEPGLFEAVAQHPATEASLVRAHRELSDCSPAALDRLAASSRRAADVVRVHRAVQDRLADDWYDEPALLAAATAAVEAGGGIVAELGRVLVHLPQRLGPAAARLLRALGQVTDVEVLAGRTGARGADRDVDRALRLLGLEPPDDAGAVRRPVGTRVVSVSDADEEARIAVASVVDASRDGIPLERIAVLYPSDRPYARLVAEHLEAAGIPSFGRAVRPLTDRLLGRWLLDVLDLPARGWRREDVFAVLAGAPVRRRDGRRVPVAWWERVSREAGVVRGRAQWRDHLDHLARSRRKDADLVEADPDDQRDWLVERLRREAADAESLRAFVEEFADAVEAGRGAEGWAALRDWAHGLLDRFLGGEDAWQRWPETERAAAEAVAAAIDRLGALDGVADGDADPDTFRRTLELELETDLGRSGRFGEGVLVGPLTSALGVDLDVVVVLGLAEGVTPTRPREDSLLPDRERARTDDELPRRTEHVDVEHRHLLVALAHAARRRILVAPRGDLRRSAELVPSRWLLDTVEVLDPEGRRQLPPPGPGAPDWFVHVPSFAARVGHAAFPATATEHRLRQLADGRRDGVTPERHPLVAGDPALRAGAELVLARASDDFTRFDGDLGMVRDLLPDPAGGIVSPTALELYVGCPHAYLLRQVLRVNPLEEPEEELTITPMQKGNLVHEVLEEWLLGELQHGVPAHDQPWSDAARDRLAAAARRRCQAYEDGGLTGHPRLWARERERLLAELAAFPARDDERRAELGATAVGAEHAFGIGTQASLEVDLGDGRTVRLRGKIDRLDRDVRGGLVVTDYKHGSPRSFSTLSEQAPDADGRKLQLPTYGLAARAAYGPDVTVRADYWFTSHKGGWKRIGYPLTDAVVDRFRHVLRVALDGIQAGHFPARIERPTSSPWPSCEHCDHDGLGLADAYRDWERLRQHERLRTYVRLAEPGAVPDDAPAADTAEEPATDTAEEPA
ncbi:PD-(D/E)XK nuclease family protein [Egicoccus sp. AB-alg2]|uniref:PD-(D/E)XK nuclease family protein n=1 Tax=Egicoccus sp. AB-alg2 TaxID=3242693 RepID=UPI00359DD57A